MGKNYNVQRHRSEWSDYREAVKVRRVGLAWGRRVVGTGGAWGCGHKQGIWVAGKVISRPGQWL